MMEVIANVVYAWQQNTQERYLHMFLQVRRFLIGPDQKKGGESRDQKNPQSLG
jgi:hypothetical protein